MTARMFERGTFHNENLHKHLSVSPQLSHS